MKILIQHGSVCLDDRIEVADILVADEKIAAIADSISTLNADRTVDASGKYVLPGLIDIHTHLDDKIGSCSLADTYRTGTEIAVRNGMTTICSFITQMQGETLGASIARAQQKADSNCYCNIGWHLTPTAFGENDWREIERSVEAGFHTFKFYTTYRNAGIYCGYERLEAIVQRLSSRGIQFLVHCEDDEVLAAQVRLMELAENLGEPITHAQMRPSGAETKAINRVMEIAVRYQAKIHIVHISTAEGAAMVQEAKRYAPVSCETAPHYFFLSDDMLRRKDGHRWICSPPLREEAQRARLEERARDGFFDLFATDHCAFQKRDKDIPFTDVRSVPNGLSGLGSLPHLVFKLFRKDVPYAMQQLKLFLSERPARLLGQFPAKGSLHAGADADIVVLDATAKPQPLQSSLADVYETFPGMASALVCSHVLLAGHEVVRDGILLDREHPIGRSIHGRTTLSHS